MTYSHSTMEKRTIQTKSLKAQSYHDIHVHDEVMTTFDHNMNYV